MDELVPRLDIPVSMLASDCITGNILRLYSNFPCKIKSGIFALCTHGTIRVTINLSEYTIRPDDLITLLPDSFIQIHEMSDDIQLSFIGFSSGIVNESDYFKMSMHTFPLIFDHPVLPLSPETASFLSGSISLWTSAGNLTELVSDEQISKNVMKVFLRTSIILYQSDKQEEHTSFSKNYRMSRDFVQLVMQHYLTERRVSFYAGKMGISVENLCRITKAQMKKTPLDVISSFLIMDAKTQLKSTKHSVKEIAFFLGFPNLTSFCKFFRKYVSMSPQEYRNS